MSARFDVRRFAVLSLILFVLGTMSHEVLHLVVLKALRGEGALTIVPWRLGLLPASIAGFHLAITSPIKPAEFVIVNFLGPALAAFIYALVREYGSDEILSEALFANIVILIFYAVIEAIYAVLEDRAIPGLGILGWPEFNLGVPLLIILLIGSRRKTP